MASNWILGIDVGGTFTDLFAFDRTTGRSALHKISSMLKNGAIVANRL
jgi:N-methylhydantoinase A